MVAHAFNASMRGWGSKTADLSHTGSARAIARLHLRNKNTTNQKINQILKSTLVQYRKNNWQLFRRILQ